MGIDPINVREASLKDAGVIARFNQALALESEGIKLEPETIRLGVEAVLADPAKGRYLVAEKEGQVVGALLLTYEWSDWRNGTFLWLQSVYVDASQRRQGVFHRLFREAARMGSAPGCCGLRLYMDRENSVARKAYERLGLSHRGYIVFESPDRLREAER